MKLARVFMLKESIPEPERRGVFDMPQSSSKSGKIDPEFLPWSEQELQQQDPEKLWHQKNLLRHYLRTMTDPKQKARVQAALDKLGAISKAPGGFQATAGAQGELVAAIQNIRNPQVKSQFQDAVKKFQQANVPEATWQRLLALAKQEEGR